MNPRGFSDRPLQIESRSNNNAVQRSSRPSDYYWRPFYRMPADGMLYPAKSKEGIDES